MNDVCESSCYLGTGVGSPQPDREGGPEKEQLEVETGEQAKLGMAASSQDIKETQGGNKVESPSEGETHEPPEKLDFTFDHFGASSWREEGKVEDSVSQQGSVNLAPPEGRAQLTSTVEKKVEKVPTLLRRLRRKRGVPREKLDL